jgi:hypothetical protein
MKPLIVPSLSSARLLPEAGLQPTYLLHIGGLDWKKINPDIFGSMTGDH